MLIQANFHDHMGDAVPLPICDAGVPALLALARPCAVSIYQANKVIYAQGEAAGPLYMVEFGTVRICRLTADGRRQINTFHFAGEIFGFEAGDKHQCYAETVNQTGIRVLRPNSPEGLGTGMLSIALKSLARAQDHLLVLGRMTAAEKMATFLLDLCERQDTDRFIELSMQRNDVADYLGLTFETVSRVLRVFKDAGMIRLPTVNQIEVLDIASLGSIVE
jgi:CRP/FNR family nitrogen fixation transcriptional regulator